VKAIDIGIDLVMSSHPYYPKLDPYPKMIATFSRRIIYDYLRSELGFQGVITTDDLEMGAVKVLCPIGEAGILAAKAGHDLLLVCHTPQGQKEVYEKLLEAYKGQLLSLQELEASVDRIQRLKSKRKQRFAGGEPGAEPAGVSLAAQICRESLVVLQDERKLLPLKRGGKSLGVIFPQFSRLDARVMIEKEVLDEKEFVRIEFQKFGLDPEIQLVSFEPTEAEIQQAVTLAKHSDLTILFCFDAHLYPANKNLLDSIQAAAQDLVLDLLRDPYDAEYIRKDAACLTDFGWRACQIKAAIEKMCSSALP
jgi:beta-N-acetylhexosaminidase